MDALAALSAGPVAPGEAQLRARIAKTAEEFEASFLASMLGTMFQGVGPAAPFHGGAGEDAFKSFLTDAMAKSMAKAGGVGLSGPLTRELLKLQGLDA